jgi:hypothetical protein
MVYRGGDLNLRAATARPWREARDGLERGEMTTSAGFPMRPRAQAIHVDALVVACCNAAFDAALFHGAREVSLEHLLYGLTRLPAAAELLEAVGVHAGQLRQETAMGIAADVAAGAIAETPRPRASEELEAVLRHAEELAQERSAPAAVADLLRALLESAPNAPAVALVRRNGLIEEALERWREDARPPDPAGDTEARARRLTEPVLARLEALESGLRALLADMSAERRVLAQTLREAEHAAREGGAAERLAPELAALTRSFEGRLGAVAEGVKVLAARLDAEARREPTEARLGALEERIAGQGAELAQTVSSLLANRLGQSLGELEQLRQEGAASSRALAEQLAALKVAVDAELERGAEARKAREEELAEIYGALLKLGTNQQTLGNNLNTWRLETSGDISIISNRLERLEKASLAATQRLSNDVAMLRSRAKPRRHRLKSWLAGQTPVLPGWRDRAKAFRRSFSRKRKGEA